MECHKYGRWIELYVDDCLSERQSRKLKEHLGACEECAVQFQLFVEVNRQMVSYLSSQDAANIVMSDYWEDLSSEVTTTPSGGPIVCPKPSRLAQLVRITFESPVLPLGVITSVLSIVGIALKSFGYGQVVDGFLKTLSAFL